MVFAIALPWGHGAQQDSMAATFCIGLHTLLGYRSMYLHDPCCPLAAEYEARESKRQKRRDCISQPTDDQADVAITALWATRDVVLKESYHT